MERRRLAAVLGGVVVLGGAVVVLRVAGGTANVAAGPALIPQPTVVRSFSAEGVLLPNPGDHPEPPGALVTFAGPHRLQLAWGAALPGGRNPAGAAGYEVRWGTGDPDHVKLVAEPAAELDGLPDNADTHVEVRSVDAFGQRSAPATATDRAKSDGTPGADNALVDHFDGAKVPDPRLWRVTGVDGCASAGRGTGDDSARLLVVAACGRGSAALRARAPFRLAAPAGGGELGRFTVDTDAPGEDGELDLTLVPGPADLVDGSLNDIAPTNAPNVASVDGDLPPGTIRVRITAVAAATPTTTVAVTVGPGTPLVTPVDQPPHAIPTPLVGRSARWDVVLRTDGIRVLRDGVDVGGGNAVPAWSQATALVEFAGSTATQLQAHVNLVGFGGAPTTPPPLVAPPTVLLTTAPPVADPGRVEPPVPADQPGSALLRLTALVLQTAPDKLLTVNGGPPAFVVEVGGRRFAATPAVPGTAIVPGARYPLVARLPADVVRNADGRGVAVRTILVVPTGYPGTSRMVSAELEPNPPAPGQPAPTPGPAPAGIPALGPQGAVLTARLLDAGGLPLPPGQRVPRGRLVVEATLDGISAQRTAGSLAGIAGIVVWLDNVKLAGVPTALEGPGIAGTYRIAFDPTDATPGAHTLDLRAYSTVSGPAVVEAFASFAVG